MCSDKGYYHGRDLIYTGTGGIGGVSATPHSLVKILAKHLGASFKLIRTKGCLGIKDELPKKGTTLGKVKQHSFFCFP